MTSPLVSVVTPVYDTDEWVLRECIDSVRAQSFDRWQLCLVDDASPTDRPWAMLREASASDPRIVCRRREHNGGIVAASNDALALATGEIVVLLDHDDRLHPDALAKIVEAFAADDQLDYVYSDEDLIASDGRRINPFYKPDWSPERFRNQMYSCHVSAIRRTLVDEVGGFREGFDGAQDWDLVFRVTERARRVGHIPEVLYHWRTVPASVTSGTDAKPYAYDAAKRAIQSHCERVGIAATVEEHAERGHFRVRRCLDEHPLVSVVIPTRGSEGVVWAAERVMVVEAVRDIVERSTYPRLEIVVVADTATPAGVLDELRALGGERLRLIDYDLPFNFSEKCNVGAARASGELLLFLNDDVQVITDDWIETLVGFARETDVGAVGCELLFEDGRIQHAGHVYIGGNPAHVMFGRLPDHATNRNVLYLDREVSGVTAAALMCRADVFDAVGGFSAEFPGNYNDVDFSLKVRSLGLRIVMTPHARLYHFESVSRDATLGTDELELIRSRWWVELNRDPYYSPHHHYDCYEMPVTYP
jgi:GT2 family glycosyltransferase